MDKIKAIIFDLDGLLLDTERIALSTFVEACREFNFEPDPDVYYRCIGTTYLRTREILTEGYGKSFPYEAVSLLWSQKIRTELEKSIPLKDGVRPLLSLLEEKGLNRAVVTSTRYESAVKQLAAADILHYFKFVIGGDQIEHGKPHPEIYLTACLRLNEVPPACLALEDSDNGVFSATAAGLQVIQVPDLKEPSAKAKALGHKIVKSLDEVARMFRD